MNRLFGQLEVMHLKQLLTDKFGTKIRIKLSNKIDRALGRII
jgi:hypothetical protein